MTPIQKLQKSLNDERQARLSAEGRVKALTADLAALKAVDVPAAGSPAVETPAASEATEPAAAPAVETPSAVETVETPVATESAPEATGEAAPVLGTDQPETPETPATAATAQAAPISGAAVEVALSMQAAATIAAAGAKENPTPPAGNGNATSKNATVEARANLASWCKKAIKG